MPASTRDQASPTPDYEGIETAAIVAVEKIANALLQSDEQGSATPTEIAADRAIREAIALVMETLIARRHNAPTRAGQSSTQCSIEAARAVLTHVLDERGASARPDEIYQFLLAHVPAYDPSSGVITLRHASGGARRSLGSFYTPDTLVRHVLSTTLDRVIEDRLAQVSDVGSPNARQARCEAILSIRVCDPACGSGRFLAAAGERLAERLVRERASSADSTPASIEHAREEVYRTCLFGVDIDPVAVSLCRHTLDGRPSANHSDTDENLSGHVRVGNALLWIAPEQLQGAAGQHTPFEWDKAFPEIFDPSKSREPGFDVVVGNPPFLNQLEQATATDPEIARLLNEIFHGAISGYADTAAAFFLLARRLTARGGRASMVMPQSFLAARDAAPARKRLLEHARLESLWISNERVFPGASVLTCAPTIHVTRKRAGRLSRYATGAFVELDPVESSAEQLASCSTWSHLAATASSVPDFEFSCSGRLADLCDATADFRDQYYGLRGFLEEHDDLTPEQRRDLSAFPPVVTSGLIDLAQCRWGDQACRLLKSRWRAPRIDRARMNREGSLGPWLTARLAPKLIVATQTRVIEVFADSDGRYVPSVPLISVTPKDIDDYWRVAAALASPVLSAHAMRHFAGAALHADAIKLSAKQVLDLPCPSQRRHWDAAAAQFRQASLSRSQSERATILQAFGAAACQAYGLEQREIQRLLEWWLPRTQRKSPRSLRG